MSFRRSCLGVVAVLPFVSGCGWGRMKPGLTKEGMAIPVVAQNLEEAKRAALRESLELFLAPGSSVSVKSADDLAARAGEFTGKTRFKKGKGIVELRFGKLLAALEKQGLLRPAGFTSREPRVLLLVSEPMGILDLGVGPAADALRRGLSAHGLAAIDGRDNLNEFLAKGKDPAALADGAARSGADWMLIAAASASAELDPDTRTWRGRASLVADQYEVRTVAPVGQTQTETSVLDVSSAAAKGKALEQAGEEAASKVAAEIKRAQAGRSEAAIFVVGSGDLTRLKSLIASVRLAEGVKGAYLGIWHGEEESVVVRVFLSGFKVDDLAARLLRRNPSLTLLSVEPELGRLAVELPGPRDD